jgi:hypothetical protein
MGIVTENKELVSSRSFYRNYATMMNRLAAGEIEKIVLTKHGKMIGVILTAENYEKATGERS